MSSINDYLAEPEFLGWCERWREQKGPPAELADWLYDRDMPGEAAGVAWAARHRYCPRKIVGRPGQWEAPTAMIPHKVWAALWGPGSVPPQGVETPAYGTFPVVVVALLTAWAKAGLSWEQLNAAQSLLDGVGTKSVQTLGGYAGTGKTTVLSYLHEYLPGWAPVAFTGKAVDVMRRKGIHNAQTIHGTVYNVENLPDGTMRYTKKYADQLAHVDGFLIEEASMVGLDVYRDLLSYGKPIIAVGDHGQLPPVGDDAELMKNPDHALVTVHRNAGPIARFAEHLRMGGDAREWTVSEEDMNRYANEWTGKFPVWVGPMDKVPEASFGRADQIICAFNRTRVKWNRKMKEARVKATGGPAIDVGEIMPGDRLIVCRNGRGVFNGQQGIVRSVASIDRGQRLVFESFGRTHSIDTDTRGLHKEKGIPEKELRRGLIPVDFGYCITCHKAQGDEWSNVVVIEERSGLWEHSRWAYTAASRAKDKLVWVTG